MIPTFLIVALRGVHLKMTPDTAVTSKLLPTKLAGKEGLLSSGPAVRGKLLPSLVHFEVPPEAVGTCELLAALPAPILLLSSVSLSHVVVEVVVSTEPLAALLALKGPLPGVHLEVLL